MTIAERVKWLRLGSVVLFIGMFICLIALYQQQVGKSETAHFDLGDGSAAAELSPESTPADLSLQALERELNQARAKVTELEKQYQEEIQINQALREDLKKATARLRRQSAKQPAQP